MVVPFVPVRRDAARRVARVLVVTVSLVCLLVYPLLAATLVLDRDFTMVNSLFLGFSTVQYFTIFVLHRLTRR